MATAGRARVYETLLARIPSRMRHCRDLFEIEFFTQALEVDEMYSAVGWWKKDFRSVKLRSAEEHLIEIFGSSGAAESLIINRAIIHFSARIAKCCVARFDILSFDHRLIEPDYSRAVTVEELKNCCFANYIGLSLWNYASGEGALIDRHSTAIAICRLMVGNQDLLVADTGHQRTKTAYEYWQAHSERVLSSTEPAIAAWRDDLMWVNVPNWIESGLTGLKRSQARIHQEVICCEFATKALETLPEI